MVLIPLGYYVREPLAVLNLVCHFDDVSAIKYHFKIILHMIFQFTFSTNFPSHWFFIQINSFRISNTQSQQLVLNGIEWSVTAHACYLHTRFTPKVPAPTNIYNRDNPGILSLSGTWTFAVAIHGLNCHLWSQQN